MTECKLELQRQQTTEGGYRLNQKSTEMETKDKQKLVPFPQISPHKQFPFITRVGKLHSPNRNQWCSFQ